MSRTQPLESIGIEIEFERPLRGNASGALSSLGGSVTYDVSAQGTILVEDFTGLAIDGDTNNFRGKRSISGGEFVSAIWSNRDDKELLDKISKVLFYLQSRGETGLGNRAGIHIHLNYVYNLRALINLMTVSAHLEKLFFWLGGMGRVHRGMVSDSIYYRPITQEGPIVVPVSKGWSQCFSVSSLQKSKSMREFWQRYGDSNGWAGKTRYPVVRYHWVNILNMYNRTDTIELRVMNTTIDPMKIWAMQKLWENLAKYALIRTPKQVVKDGLAEPISVFEESPEAPELTFIRFLKAVSNCGLEVNKIAVKTLIDMLGTPEPTLKKRYVRSHLHDRHTVFYHWEGISPIPEKRIDTELICHPIYVDSYVEKGEVNPQTRFSSISSMKRGTTRRSDMSTNPAYGEYEE